MTTTLTRMQDVRMTGALAVVLALAGLAFANFGLAEGESGGTPQFFVTGAVCVVLAAALFGRVVPSAADTRKAAMWLAALSVLTLPVFWSGLPIVLGLAAVAAGARAGGAAGSGAAVVGALATAAALAGCIVG